MPKRILIDGKTRIIKGIKFEDEKHFEANYHGWHISIYPMFGKLVNGRYRDDLETGEFGNTVRHADGGKIVDSVQPTKEKAIQEAMENILTCRPCYVR